MTANYTDRGLADVILGLAHARASNRERMGALRAQMGVLEAELANLGKIDAAASMSIELLRAEQTVREAAAKAAKAAASAGKPT